MAIPSFTLTATSTTITMHVYVTEGYTMYKLYLRRTDDETAMIWSGSVNDVYYNQTEDIIRVATGLEPGVSYTANIRYSTDASTAENILCTPLSITTRPLDWTWTTNIATGTVVPKYGESLAPITAAEWNSFCSRINKFREHMYMDDYSFTIVSQGTQMTKAVINQAITAISGISGHGTLPTPSNAIEAAFWIQLAAALNAIS